MGETSAVSKVQMGENSAVGGSSGNENYYSLCLYYILS